MAMVVGLFTCPDKGQSMISHESVTLTKDVGIEGDRYALGLGAYSNATPLKVRHVTVISLEAIIAANEELERLGHSPFTPELTRRNIVVFGVQDLNALATRDFFVGGIRLRGVELADPCHRPTMLSGARHKDFPVAFAERGGVRARVMASGPLKLGDEVDFLRGL